MLIKNKPVMFLVILLLKPFFFPIKVQIYQRDKDNLFFTLCYRKLVLTSLKSEGYILIVNKEFKSTRFL